MTEEFVEEEPSSPDDRAGSEKSFFDKGKPKSNTVFIPLWKSGHLAWQSDSSAPVLALIMLILLCFLIVTVQIISLASAQEFKDLFQILGNAVSAVVGAVWGRRRPRIQRNSARPLSGNG